MHAYILQLESKKACSKGYSQNSYSVDPILMRFHENSFIKYMLHETGFCYRKRLSAEVVKEFVILYKNMCATNIIPSQGKCDWKDNNLDIAYFC